MKFLKHLGITILILIFISLVFALILPNNAKISERITIKAQTEQVFKQVNNLRNWEKWGPYLESDPTMQLSYIGPKEGEGAQMTWISPDLGNGKMSIEKSITNKTILTKVKFEKNGDISGEWQFKDLGGDSTSVIWTTHINQLGYPIGRIFGLFLNKKLSPFLKRGLHNLKNISEKLPKLSPILIEKSDGFHAITISDSATLINLSTKFALDFNKLYKYLSQLGLKPSGRPFGIFNKISDKGISFTAGIPIAQKTKNFEDIKSTFILGKKYIQSTHFGSYNSVGQTYSRLNEEIQKKHLKITGPSMELFITDPLNIPDTSDWETRILIPIK